jgi:hypothetical protein
MKSKTFILVIQLLFVIVVVAVIATHVRMVQNKEMFADTPVQGTVGSDQNLTVTGNIVGLSGSHQLGNSKLPDEKGDIHLTPRLGNNSVFLNGKTVINNKLCFRKENNDEMCFDANKISKRTDNVQISESGIRVKNDKELEFGDGQSKHVDAGKIRYGGWDNSALNIVGAGADGNNRKVRVWDNLCIGKQCMEENDIKSIKQLPNRIQAIKNDTQSMIATQIPNNALQLVQGRVQIPNDNEVEFGAGQGKQVDAGKIRYGGWDNALNIVGAGSDGWNRKVRVWDRLQIGPLEIQNDGCIRYGPNNAYRFCFQSDGNVVQYKVINNKAIPVWATNKYD